MGDIFNDVRLALTLIVLIYLSQWAISGTGSRKIGIVVALVLVYLTVYQHFILLVLVMAFFFGYAFFESFESTFIPLNPE
ncbi:hypothetical protein K8R43_04080 [archaeon]|nr:hypothetical protein [archaeon]